MPSRWTSHLTGYRRVGAILLAIGVVLTLALFLLGPTLVERLVEKSLADMPGGYRGTVEGVSIRPLDCEVALLGLRIEKKNGKIPVPFIDAKELVVGAVRDSWKPRSTLRMVEPVISWVDAESEALKQTGPKFDPAELRKQLPFELLTVRIERAAMHFRNFQTKPDLDVALENVSLVWDELVGCLPPGSQACRSTLRVSGDVLDSGKLTADGAFARVPEVRFELEAKLRGVRAAKLSPLLRHYAKVDVKSGEVGLDATYRRRADAHSALIVPRVRELEIMGDSDEGTRFGRELGLAMAAGWLERKQGEKGIRLRSKPNGSLDYELIDLPARGAKERDDE